MNRRKEFLQDAIFYASLILIVCLAGASLVAGFGGFGLPNNDPMWLILTIPLGVAGAGICFALGNLLGDVT